MAQEATEESVVECVVADAVATITLNRPRAGNALNLRAKHELLAAIRRVGPDERVRAVVLTGAGTAFCAGQDLKEHAAALAADPAEALNTVREHYNPIVLGLREMPKPVIAAINGTCVGAGLGLALAADLRIAVPGVRIGAAFSGIGLASDSGLSASLVHTIGASRAAALLISGDWLTSEGARDWGLVHQVVPADALVDETGKLAGRLAIGPTAAYAEIKKLLRVAASAEFGELLEREADAQTRLGTTADHRNAVTAFLNKQVPTFEGR